MMAGNPNWWSMNGMHSQSHQLSSPFVFASQPDHLPNQDFPVRSSWSQLLLGGLGGGEEERFGASLFQQQKKLENWEDQVMNLNPSSFARASVVDVKQEIISQSNPQINYDDELITPNSNSWSHPINISSPTSCITTNNFLNFSGGKSASERRNQHSQDHSSECNSTGTGGVSKKARVQTSAQPALKVRKEKLGDRITALHQLVSPFGKTDTASVLSEAIGYIRFLQGQIEVQERNCLFPEEPSQFLNDIGIEGRGASKQDSQGRSGVNDLSSRGLCLVPISCTQHVGNDTGADYWAPAAFGGGF
ncbi:hypothetical protein ACS0TY_035145 [Phlomoides rotata]